MRKKVTQEFMRRRPSLLKTIKPKSALDDHHEVELIQSVEFFQKHEEGVTTEKTQKEQCSGVHEETDEYGAQNHTPVMKKIRKNAMPSSRVMINNFKLK